MPAAIEERADVSVILSNDDDRGAAQLSHDIVTGLRYLAYMTEITPAPVEYAFELQPIDVIAGKRLPAYQPVFPRQPIRLSEIRPYSARQFVMIAVICGRLDDNPNMWLIMQ